MSTEFRYWVGEPARYDALINRASAVPERFKLRVNVCASSPVRSELAGRISSRIAVEKLNLEGLVRWCKAMGWGPEIRLYRLHEEVSVTVHCYCRDHFMKRSPKRQPARSK